MPLYVDDFRENDVDRLEVYDSADAFAYTIPVSADDAGLMANKVGVNEGQVLYEHSLGHRPFNGRYRVIAKNTAGTTIDFVTVEFNCFSDIGD